MRPIVPAACVWRRRCVLLAITGAVLSGCTFSAIKSDPDTPPPWFPPNKPLFIVLGNVKATDPAWEPHRMHFVRGFTEWFKNNSGVPDVVTDRAAQFPAEAVILTGTITDVDRGNAPLRWLVGMGAGRAEAEGDFEILDDTGHVLTRFHARESYLGGAGIRGPGFLDMEDLVRRLGATVAKSARRWANGDGID